MAAKTFGIAHLFGIAGTIANATVLSFNKDNSFLLEDNTVDESGKQIERRYDDEGTEATIVIRMRAAYTKPAIGTTLTYDSVTYEIVSSTLAEEAKGYKTFTLKLRNSEAITYA